MKKTFKLEELDCANCANKMERAVCALEGVENAQINFMRQSLVLEAPDEMFEDILQKAQKVMRKIEPDVRIVI